ncbi:SET domain-containing protein [Ditylenchus destructor]|uniref:SET domain-containing protein n=1 Tax=Ditylenchus destructor TaxID=166010 RepID=A0AAD4MWZ9_9BILA|nr:SET domain-containing protein [Ditylenchus destructor]
MDRKRRRTSNRSRAVHQTSMYDESNNENASPRQSCRKASLNATLLIKQFKKEEQIAVHQTGMFDEGDKENASLRQSCRKASLTASHLIEEFKKEEQIYKDGEAEKENMVPLLSFDNIRRSPSVEIIEENNEDPEQEVNDTSENEREIPENAYEVESILAESDQLKKYADRNELMALICSTHGTKVVWPYKNAWMSYAFYPCREWEDKINRLISQHGHARIYIENLVDEAAAPENFEYGIKSRISDRALKLLEINMEQSAFCECLPGSCGKNKNCICSKMGIPYTKQGRLSRRYRDKPSIFECSDLCGCGEDCPLRMVQRGRKFPIILFRTLHKGWSIRSAVDIPSGSYVAEYIGEVITSREADATGSTEYQFQVNGILNDGQFVIDAAYFGNEGRFINHSCDPNLDAYKVFIRGESESLERIAFFAARAVKKGEELTINYWNDEQYEGVNKADQKKKRKCLCQSKECRGFMP